jgi:NADPH:quinone reductase-like Zn-dependent oxidoreductase
VKAMVLDQPGRPLRLRRLAKPKPGPTQVLVKVVACGVCRTDLHVIDGELSKPKLPLIPGHEIVGLVEGIGSFDGAYMLRVGMNIVDKDKLALEVARVLRPGSLFGIYDVMQTGPGELAYPVPWATTPDLSAVAKPERYKEAL